MLRFLFLLPCFLVLHPLLSQEKVPYIFRQYEKRAIKNVRHYLPGDTIIETSGAKLHLHYSKNDNKPWLLLLHGMGANARSNWYRQFGPLSAQYNLLVPDLIYFGESTSKQNNFSVEFQVSQIHEAIQLLGVNHKIHVMGFSYGGLVAAVYNERYANEVNKLIIMDGPVKFFSAQMADSIARAAGSQDITSLIVPENLQDFNAMQKAVLSKNMWASRRFKKKFIRYFFTPSRTARIELLKYLIQNESIYQTFHYGLKNTSTLLVWGAKDGVVPLMVGKALHDNYPETTQLLIFKKAKHDVHFSNSKALNKAVLNFLKN